MFWKKASKTLRVEVVNLPSGGPLATVTASKPETQPTFISFDSWLKLCVMLVAVTNCCLLVAGYMRHLGVMEAYGIQRTEISLSVSDLLATGYALILKPATSGMLASCVVGGGLTVVSAILVWAAIKEGTSNQRGFLSWCIASVFVVALYAPLAAYILGKDVAFEAIAPALKVKSDQIKSLEKSVEIPTNDGPLAGELILATPDFVFLRVDTTIYKITADTNVVVRKTVLSLPSKPK